MTEIKGKRRNPNVYTIEFDDSNTDELAGLVIRTKGPTLAQLFAIAELGNIDLKDINSEGMAAIKALTMEFPDRMIAWNFETEDGIALPPTAAVFLSEDWTFTLPIVQAWMQTALKDPRVQKKLHDIRGEMHNRRMAEAELPDNDDEEALSTLAMN